MHDDFTASCALGWHGACAHDHPVTARDLRDAACRLLLLPPIVCNRSDVPGAGQLAMLRCTAWGIATMSKIQAGLLACIHRAADRQTRGLQQCCKSTAGQDWLVQHCQFGRPREMAFLGPYTMTSPLIPKISVQGCLEHRAVEVQPRPSQSDEPESAHSPTVSSEVHIGGRLSRGTSRVLHTRQLGCCPSTSCGSMRVCC